MVNQLKTYTLFVSQSDARNVVEYRLRRRMLISDWFCGAMGTISTENALLTLRLIQSNLGATLRMQVRIGTRSREGGGVYTVSDRQKFGAMIDGTQTGSVLRPDLYEWGNSIVYI